MRSVAFCTLGCKVNQYETDAMQERFAAAGYEIRPFTEHADVYIVNTCTVTNIADRKSRQMLHRARKRNPDALVAAVGCYVETSGGSLDNDGTVDIILGNDDKKNIVEIVDRAFLSMSAGISGTDPELSSYTDVPADSSTSAGMPAALPPDSPGARSRAYIKIQDGCNQFCSYCVIPYARGRVRSRSMDDIISEARSTVSLGYSELVITGIHISSYGMDFGKRNTGAEEEYGPFPGETLIELIERLSEVEGLKRIRLGSLEPRIITEAFLRRLKEVPQICPHFHLSLQSGCDTVLKRMNRHYTSQLYYEKCLLLRKYFDRPAITTDIIVGFPGETDEEFNRTMEFARRVHFSAVHVFRYSRRNGTRAASMPGQVSPEKMAERSRELISVARKMHSEFIQECIGQQVEVLIEEEEDTPSGKVMTGYSRNYIRCIFDDLTLRPGDVISGRLNRMFTEETAFCEECR